MILMDTLMLFSFGELFGDLGFIIKLFVLVAILGFLNQHIENKILKVVVALFMIYVIVFASSTLRFIYVVYAVMGMGISSIFVDYFFMNQGGQDHAEGVFQQARGNAMQKEAAKYAAEHGVTRKAAMEHFEEYGFDHPGDRVKKKKGILGFLGM